jgi:hypothetical protein
MANALVRLLLDPALRVTRSAQGRRIAEDRSWEAVWDRLFADYDEVRLRVPRDARRAPTAAGAAMTVTRA